MSILLTGLVFLAAQTIKTDQTPLRSGCSADDSVVAKVSAGTPASVLYSMTGDHEMCYKISVSIDGKTVSGYVPASALEGLDSFTKEVRSAPAIADAPPPKTTFAEKSMSGGQASGTVAPGGIPMVEKSYGRFLVRSRTEMNPAAMTPVLAQVDQSYTRASNYLGCKPTGPMVVVMEEAHQYSSDPMAGAWSASYDGNIRLPLPDGSTPPALYSRIVLQQAVHSCLVQMGQWPAWLHEGLALRMSGESAGPQSRGVVRAALRRHQLPPIDGLGASYARRSAGNVAIANFYSLMGIDFVVQRIGPDNWRGILRNHVEFNKLQADLIESFESEE